VRLSCHKLLHGDGAAEGGKDSRQLLHLTSHKLHQYYQTLAQRAPRGPGAIGSGSGDSSGRAEVVEAVDDGPRAQRECYNRHPQCDLWLEKVRGLERWRGCPGGEQGSSMDGLHGCRCAGCTRLAASNPPYAVGACFPHIVASCSCCCGAPLQGECQTNPKYMLGDEGKKNGWCMPACGKCKAPAEEDAGSNALSGEHPRQKQMPCPARRSACSTPVCCCCWGQTC
jgi:hypothetical protein